MFTLLGIDDTDTIDQSSTATLALDLGKQFEATSLAKMINLSCHQLIQSPAVTHTRENIACCLMLDVEPHKLREVDLACRNALLHLSVPGANPGYALAAWNQFDPEIVVWGKTAKIIPLQRLDAIALSRQCGIQAAGIFGSGAGMIGALAAIGLRFEGNDGWIEWMPGLSALTGIYSVMDLNDFVHFDQIESDKGKRPALDDKILFENAARPVLKNGKIILRVTATKKGVGAYWQV